MILIKTKRFVLRNFKTSDISKNYLSWFKDPKNQFIINKIRNIKQLKKYSISNLNNKNVLFFAIDDPKKNIHIGNLKLERKKKIQYIYNRYIDWKFSISRKRYI